MNRLIVRLTDTEGTYCWRLHDARGDWLEEPQYGTLRALAQSLTGRAVETWLLLPGTGVICQFMTFTAKERRHLASMAPFQFEELVATDVDRLHFALGEPEGEQVPVAYTESAWLAKHLEAFAAVDLDVHVCTPEPLMLPREAGEWSLRFDRQVSVHYGKGLGFAIEPGLITPALESLLAETEAPRRVLLLADDKEGLADLKVLLPTEAGLQVEIEEHLTDAWDSFGSMKTTAVNLRQGAYARRLPIERWWQEWRKVAYVAAAAIVLYAGVNVGGYQVLKAENQELRREIEKAYRSAIPRGRVSDPEKQLKAKVAELSGGAISGSVMQVFSQVAPLIASAEDVTLQALNYTDQRGELRLNLHAKTFNALEQLRAQLVKRGLEAELLNASAQDGGHQARMRIKQVL